MTEMTMNAVQMDLLFTHSRDTLCSYLEKQLGKTISLTITDNSTSIISVKTVHGFISLRLHRMFLDAGDDVIKEIAQFVKRRKGNTPLIRDFIKRNQSALVNENKGSRKVVARTQGEYRDLQELFGLLNKQYFDGKIKATISWGKKTSRWAVRKRTLGSYSHHTNTIWINPALDRRNVPRYLVKFIVYHEMLHSVIPVETRNGRRRIHPPEFKRRERLFERYERVLSWEKRQ
jgi:hypothetical protein